MSVKMNREQKMQCRIRLLSFALQSVDGRDEIVYFCKTGKEKRKRINILSLVDLVGHYMTPKYKGQEIVSRNQKESILDLRQQLRAAVNESSLIARRAKNGEAKIRFSKLAEDGARLVSALGIPNKNALGDK